MANPEVTDRLDIHLDTSANAKMAKFRIAPHDTTHGIFPSAASAMKCQMSTKYLHEDLI
jgi:hypothetical protein